VDRVLVQVLVDGAYNLFLRPGEVKGVKIERPPRRLHEAAEFVEEATFQASL
jgi:hypothetical protein